MKEERKYSSAHPNHPRVHKVTFMLNDEEHKAVKRYLSRYKIREQVPLVPRDDPFSHPQDLGGGLSDSFQRK